MEEIKIDVKMKAEDIYNFLMFHTYTKISGMLSAVLGLVMFGILIYNYKDASQGESLVYFIFGLFFLIFNPINFYIRARKQVKTNPAYKEAIIYIFSKEGITTKQNEKSVMLKWSDIKKVVSTGKSIIIYISNVRASIIPVKAIGENYDVLIDMLQQNVEPAKYRMKRK